MKNLRYVRHAGDCNPCRRTLQIENVLAESSAGRVRNGANRSVSWADRRELTRARLPCWPADFHWSYCALVERLNQRRHLLEFRLDFDEFRLGRGLLAPQRFESGD